MPATLASLRVRDLALVEEAELAPPRGFLAITGETGAGKSVLLGALQLLLGARADRGLVRAGAEACAVEAVFEGVESAEVAALLEEAGVEPCEEGRLLLRRIVQATGTGRQFVNGCACTLALLRQLGERLVDLHGPHDHQSLFSRENQTRLLDDFAQAGALRDAFVRARGRLMALEAEARAWEQGEQAALREMDLLEHQVAEIRSAALKPGEDKELEARHRAAASAARRQELAAAMLEVAQGEGDGLWALVAELVRHSRELERLDPAFADLGQDIRAMAEATSALARRLERYLDTIETDPAALQALEARIATLHALQRKYGPRLDDILAYGEEAARKLEALRQRVSRVGSLDAELALARAEMNQLAENLSRERRRAAEELEKRAAEGLRDLGFARCGFHIVLEPVSPPGPLGAELAEFVFAPNPGEAPRPLRAIASSGEISRVMLALKGALAAQDRVPLLVFDEIDANVGGEIAGKVAARMRELARHHQVICVTHLPQVAAAAEEQWVVSKEIHHGRAVTRLTPCAGPAREAELARMLGGRSATALAHARELLRQSAQGR